MPPKAQENVEKLEKELHSRMVVSGEWDRINRRLKRRLDESGWTDDVKDRATEECRRMPKLNVRTLENSIGAHAHDAIPPDVKKMIMDEIRQFVEDNLDS